MARRRFKKVDLALLAIFAVMLVLRLPAILQNFEAEGTVHAPVARPVLGEERTVSYPPAGGAVAIYWATWCAPCKLEMNRLRASVDAGKIPRDRIFAISQTEDAATIKQFLAKSPYPFVFLAAHPQDTAFKVAATPTMLLWHDQRVLSMGTGLSLWGIWRAEQLFP